MDLKLDNINGDPLLPKDLVIDEDGNMLTTERPEEDAQRVEIRLRTETGEWVFDEAMGIPWRSIVLVKAPDLRQVRTAFVEEILTPETVSAIREINLDFNTLERVLTVDFTALTTDGDTITGSV